MDAQSILTIMKMTQPLATLAHAEAMAEFGRSRGLTPFAEFYAIFSEKKEKRGNTWVVIGLKGLTFKEHYAVQGRWSQKSGGYSTPIHTTDHDVEHATGYNDKQGNPEYIVGVGVRVGIITNRDYAALAQMAMAQIPGWDYKEEREAFIHYGEAFVPYSHRPPSGWTIEGVARKRATEMALKLAFGKEPTQAANIYAVSMDEQRPRLELEGAGSLLYPEHKSRPALAVVDAEPVTLTVEEEVDDGPPIISGEGEWFDEADAESIAELQAEADAGLPGTPATRSVTKATRPYSPAELRDGINRSVIAKRKNAETLGPRLANFKKAIVGNLSRVLANDQERHLVTGFLVGKPSSKDWDDAETLALHNWLNATEDEGGVWTVDPLAEDEAHAVVPVAFLAAGQQPLDF